MADPIDPVLDGPPAESFDVKISPDSPPASPFQVSISPDRPPAGTFDVPVNPDLPPLKPFDVNTTADSAPRAPFDVQISLDGPPVTPVSVNVTPDGPPAIPFQVTTTPDAPPGAPFQVSITPDHGPVRPFNVAITPSRPPAVPFDVPTTRDIPALQIQSDPGQSPTIDQIVNAVIKHDRTLGVFLAGIVEIEPISIAGPGGAALDPTELAKWFRNYVQAVGGGGMGRFITQQSELYAMNPVTARVFDPSYFIKMMIPGSMGHARTTIDTEAGVTMESVARLREVALAGAVSSNPVRPGGDGMSGRPDAYGPENKYTDGQAYSVDSIVDAAIDAGNAPVDSPFMKTEKGIMRFDASSFFESRSPDGAMLVRATAKARAAASIENVANSKLAASNALDGVIRVAIPGEELDGSVLSTTQDPSDVVDDDDARVPLSFTDLRHVPGKMYRSVYFRPTGLQFSESIAPEYNEASTFGRVDAVVGYQRTSRTVAVSFEVHAMAPEEIELMYKKMIWLKSMCYPTIGSDSLISSGPVVRMRIGDAVGTDLGGAPGIIKSLSFDFADAMWELKRGMKVPKMFKVSLEFLVLHDGPVGIMNGVFGVFQLPAGGPAPDKDTNLAGNPTDGVTQLPGRFARFGEPRS